MNKKTLYESPKIEILEIEVETGFSTSDLPEDEDFGATGDDFIWG